MTIAVNTRSFSKKNITDDCIKNMITALAKDNPKHCFIFFDSNSSLNAITAQLWHTLKLPALLKKNKANLLINVNLIQPIKTSIPQLQIIDTPEQLQVFKKSIATALHQTKKIIATSLYIKNKIEEIYKTEAVKVEVVYKTADLTFTPMDWNEKQEVLKKHSTGKSIFYLPKKNTMTQT